MKRIRLLWIIVLGAVTLGFALYLGIQTFTLHDGGPVFTVSDEPLTLSIEDTEDALLQGITAQDGRDGDVTDSILVEKLSGFYGDHKRLVTYAAFDSDDNVTKATREISYSDYTSPRFGLTHALRWKTGESIDLSELVTATDCLDGDLTNKVKIRTETTVSSRTSGVYAVTFSVTNSAGDTQTLETQLEVYDSQINEATLTLSDYLVYWDGEEIDYRSYLSAVSVGGQRYDFGDGAAVATAVDGSTLRRTQIGVRSQLDTGTPGVYPVYLTYQDEDYQGATVLLVVVE